MRSFMWSEHTVPATLTPAACLLELSTIHDPLSSLAPNCSDQDSGGFTFVAFCFRPKFSNVLQ